MPFEDGFQEQPDVASPGKPSAPAADPEAARAELKAKNDAAILAAIDEADPDHDDEGMGEDAAPAAEDAKPKGGKGKKARAEPKSGEGDEDDSGQEPLPEEDDDDLEGDEADEDDEDTQASGDEDEDAPADEDEDDEEDQLHRAWNALREMDVPASVLKNMPKAKLIAWGMKVIEKGKTPGGAAADSTQPEGDTKGQATKAGDAEAAQPAATDWSQISKSFAEELGVDEVDASKGLKPLFDIIDSLRAEIREAKDEAKASNRAALSREGQATIEMQVRRLEKKYPDLSRNEDKREEVLEEVRTLVAGLKSRGKEIDPASVFDRAALTVYGKPKRSDIKQLQRNGLSTAPTSRHDRMERPGTSLDYYAKVLDEVDAGRPDRARRIKPPHQYKARAAL